MDNLEENLGICLSSGIPFALVPLLCTSLVHMHINGDGSNSKIGSVFNICNCRATVDEESITDKDTGTIARINKTHDEARINKSLTATLIYVCHEANNANSDWKRLTNSKTGEKSNWIAQTPDASSLFSTAFEMVGFDPEALEEDDDLQAKYINALTKWCAELMEMSAQDMANWIKRFISDDTPGLWLGSCQTIDEYLHRQLEDHQPRGRVNLFRFILINFAKVSGLIFAMV